MSDAIRWGSLLAGAVLTAASMLVARAAAVPPDGAGAPRYVPAEQVAGVIRTWGNDQMGGLMAGWQAGFGRYQPRVAFETTLKGSGTGIAGLYTGVADLALMGRPATATEIMAFQWVFRYPPWGGRVATGSVAAPGVSYAIAILVHRDNPITRLTLAQVNAVSDAVTRPRRWPRRGAISGCRSPGRFGPCTGMAPT